MLKVWKLLLIDKLL